MKILEAEYEALITGSGQGALGLHFASGRRVYIPLKGDWADLCMLVQKCNRAGLDPAPGAGGAGGLWTFSGKKRMAFLVKQKGRPGSAALVKRLLKS